jgi:molecular chaperone IbpA
MSLSHLDPFTVGFESIFDRLDSIFEAKSNSFPHYDLIKVDEENYLIKLCLAGFKKEDINIHLEEGQLTIEGESKEQNEGRYLHQGISARKFRRNFSIADTVEVLKAEMRDGILTLSLHNKIPESRKPKKIEII